MKKEKPGWYLPIRPDGSLSRIPIYYTPDFPFATGWTLGPSIADLLRDAALKNKLIWGFHAGDYPQYTNDPGGCELCEIATADEINGLVTVLRKALDDTERLDWLLSKFTVRQIISPDQWLLNISLPEWRALIDNEMACKEERADGTSPRIGECHKQGDPLVCRRFYIGESACTKYGGLMQCLAERDE